MILLVILYLVITFYILIKFFVPFISNISVKIYNKNLSFAFSLLMIMGGAFMISYIPIHIYKNMPKNINEINEEKYSNFIKKAKHFKNSNNYDSAIIYYDSAEKYSKDPFSLIELKSDLKYKKGDYKNAIFLISELIQKNEKLNTPYQSDYLKRSQYYFVNRNYENAISDLKIANKIDTFNLINIETQISMLYLLSNKNDSALTHMFNAEKNSLKLRELYSDEQIKELNLLKCIYYIRKDDKQTACQYFKLYNENRDTKIYSDLYFDENWIDNWESVYFNLFKDDINQIKKNCD